MRLLVDSHSLLWFVGNDARLSATARALISDPTNEPLLSMASCWEIAIKRSIGRLTLLDPYDIIGVLGIELAHTIAVASLPQHHGDPFDRLLIAQAVVEQMPIVSRDVAFDAYPITRLW